MARIVVAVYMFRYSLGGMISLYLQWLAGLKKLGHEVWIVEKANYHNACFNPNRERPGDDPSHGIHTVSAILEQFGFSDHWCFVDVNDNYYGMTQDKMNAIWETADLYLDLGNHGAWLEDIRANTVTVMIDGEPGYRQMKMVMYQREGGSIPRFDYYYSNGAALGKSGCTAPTAGLDWHGIYNPVHLELFPQRTINRSAPFTTVMNWKAHESLEFDGAVYGQKDIEFRRFIDLPGHVTAPMEVAVSGDVPGEALTRHRWRTCSAVEVTSDLTRYFNYIQDSMGEFSVCKNVFVVTHTGWFSDRSATYLACGRPVVMQDTGFSNYLPCGKGLFAVTSVEQAASAIDEIRSNASLHSKYALDISREYLATDIIIPGLLTEVGIG